MPDKTQKMLIQFVAARRKERGITQVQLAKRLKKSQEWVSRFENCHNDVFGIRDLIRFGKLLEFDPAQALASALKASGDDC